MKAILSKDRTDGQTAFKESLSHGDYVRSYGGGNPAKNKMNDFSHSNKNCFREIQHSSHGPRTSLLVLNNSIFFYSQYSLIKCSLIHYITFTYPHVLAIFCIPSLSLMQSLA